MKKTITLLAIAFLLIACEDKESDTYPLWTPSLTATRGDGTITLEWFKPFYPWYNFMTVPTSDPKAFEIYLAAGSPDRMKKVATVENTGNYSFTIHDLDNGTSYYAEVKAKGYFMKDATSNTIMVIPGENGNILPVAGDTDVFMESGSLAGDSKTLAYVNPYFTWNNGMYGAMALFTIDLDTHVRTIVDTSAYFPDWSPVESRLVFCTSEHEISLQGYIPQQIAVFDPATGTGTKLTEGNDFNANPDFSPDGNWIVYSSDAGNHGTFELWKMASDGSQKTQLSENLELSGMNYGTIGLGRPVWSPDAEYIYFNRLSDEAADMDIFRMPSAGGVAEPVIQSPWNDYIPAVSPDHTKTAFISDRSGSVQIWLYEPASGRYRQVTGDGRFGILTDWGKLEWVDAETILFSGYETDTYSKYGVFTVKIID